jgi:hypothetical protein
LAILASFSTIAFMAKANSSRQQFVVYLKRLRELCGLYWDSLLLDAELIEPLIDPKVPQP